MRTIALIPAYEPDEKMLHLLSELKMSGFDIVVVDDGSGFEFSDIFNEAKNYSKVIAYSTNKGKGYALKTGLAYIKEAFPSDSVIVTLDADGQHLPSDACKVCYKAYACKDTLVLSARTFKKDVPLRSRFGNRLTSAVFKLSAGTSVSDTQTGLRAFSYDMIPFMLSVTGDRYEYEMNVLLSCRSAGITIAEIPIETIYLDGNKSSHFNAIKDSIRIYREILKFSLSSLAGFGADYTCFALFSMLLQSFGAAGLVISNIAARLVSGTLNYTLNRRFVFKSPASLASFFKYALLAAFILFTNTIILSLLVEMAGMSRMLAKILVEMFMFFVSMFIQKRFIFQNKMMTVNKERSL